MSGSEAIWFAFIFIFLGGLAGLGTFLLAAHLWAKRPPLTALWPLFDKRTKD